MIIKKDFEIDTKNMQDDQKMMLKSKEDSILNEITDKLMGKQKQVSGKDWRLIHDDVKVVSLFTGSGITYTLDKVVEFATKELALAEIELLELDDSALNIKAEMDGKGKVVNL